MPKTLPGIGQPSAAPPRCKDCGNSDNVVRWLGNWVCKVHLKVAVRSESTRFALDTIQLPTHVRDEIEAENTITFGDVFPNRRARRAAERHKSRV